MPQSQHVHVLLTQGQRLLEQLFPGLATELTAAGAPTIDWTADWLMLGRWKWMPRCSSGLTGRVCSRTLLEWVIRQRLLAYPNLTLLSGRQVEGLLSINETTRVTGVKLHWRDSAKPAIDSLIAALVVDASGVTLGGVGRDYPPTDEAGFLAFAHSLRVPVLYDLLKDAQPLSPIYRYRRTENRWRHYEHLRHFPDGIVAIKDAVCVFNPVYGQGMTTAALGAMALDRCLKQKQSKSLNGFPLRFHNQLARILHTPWLMATGEDGRWSTTEGAKPRWSERLVQKYVDRVSLLMQDSPTLLTAFAEVVHMVKPPTALFAPSILSQVLTSYNKRVATDIDLS